MGFRKSASHRSLTFEGTTLEGLEVEAKASTIDNFIAMQRCITDADTDPDKASEFLERLAAVIVSWNWENDAGEPVPATLGGLQTQELADVVQIFLAWGRAIASVPNPLPANSNDGATSLERSIPMEAA